MQTNNAHLFLSVLHTSSLKIEALKIHVDNTIQHTDTTITMENKDFFADK